MWMSPRAYHTPPDEAGYGLERRDLVCFAFRIGLGFELGYGFGREVEMNKGERQRLLELLKNRFDRVWLQITTSCGGLDKEKTLLDVMHRKKG